MVNPLSRVWTEYNVRFEDFKLSNPKDSAGNPITSTSITHVGFAFQYFYYDSTGRAMPMYSMSNPVYVDNMRFSINTVTGTELKERVISMDGDKAKIDDFESYTDTAGLMDIWMNAKSFDYQKIELSNEVSSEGGNHSMALQYKSKNDSPSYAIAPAVSDGVVVKAVRFCLKSEVACTAYFNIYLNIGGTIQQYRVQIDSVPNTWTEYTIGFNHFTVVAGTSGRALLATDLQFTQRFTFGVTYNGDSEATLRNLYVDSFEFDASAKTTTYNTRTIG